MKIYPMTNKSETHETLHTFIHEVGVPEHIHSDDAKEVMEGKLKKICRDYGIKTTYTEPHSPWQNRAEAAIRELKRHVHRKMKARNVPLRLEDFCCKWSCSVKKACTASNLYPIQNRTPFEVIMGYTPDISSLAAFDFYEPVWYYDPDDFPKPKQHLGRWLGEATHIGQAMCYYILPSSGIPIARSTVQAVTEAEKMQEEVRQELARLDINIKDKIGSNESGADHEQIPNYFELYTLEEDDEINTPTFEPQEDVVPDSGDFDPEILDQYIAAQVQLPQGDNYVLGAVVARKRDAHGNPIGKASENPIFDTRVYQVSFLNGNTEEYSANIIAENLFSQIDQEGNQYLLIQEIIDHKYEPNESDNPASLNGWYLCVLWKTNLLVGNR
jgi:hypothetical protein